MFGCSEFEEIIPNQLSVTDLTIDNISTQLPVISLKTDADEFENMFSNYEENIEIDGWFSLYRNGQKVIADEEIELEIKGNYSTQFALKSLGIKFEDKYDNSDGNLIQAKTVLPFHNLDKIKAIRLRNSGNDFHKSMIKDLCYAQLAAEANLDLDLTYGESAVVFVNSEFYGILNLRTEANTNGMAGLYDAKKDDITLAKVANPHVEHKDGDFGRIDRLIEAVENADVDYLKTEIDLDNFTDYMVFQSFIANADWPHTNVRFFAIKEEKFRFVLFDLDRANTIYTKRSSFIFVEGEKENVISDLFSILYAEADFKTKYDKRFRELLNSDLLSTAVFTSIVQQNTAAIEKEMPWQIEKYKIPHSKTEWYIETQKLIDMYRERVQIVLSELE